MNEIMQNRYSCREYKNEKINDDLVKEIISLTRLTPSSLALEPWKFVVVSKELDQFAKCCYNQNQVATASHAVVIMARTDLRSDDKFLSDIIKQKGKDEDKFREYLGKVGAKMDAMSQKDLEHYASLQCYMACANLINIAYSKGVKSCIIGGFDQDKVEKYLNLDPKFKACIVISLGLSDAKSTPKIRQSLNEVMEWI
ncbi:MAG: NAD(P)H-dependent oxidoreductase [Campylobacter sp.]|nr:NAD(P)H-dependent oxidoreductase [Campylobacter sp.]